MCPILDGYGFMTGFLIPLHALVWTAFTEPAGGIMNSASLVASSRYLDTWEECREGGVS